MSDPTRNLYSNISEFPIPDGAEPIDCLSTILAQISGIVTLLRDEDGNLIDSGQAGANALWLVDNLLSQAGSLINYWNALEKAGRE